MPLVIKDQTWQLAEKLYIHSYRVEGFIDLLKSHEIVLPDDFYSGFEVYAFMTTVHNEFARFMQKVPSHRYLSLLKDIIFDGNIRNTQRDNWNYLGVQIKTWYPELLKSLEESHLEISMSEQEIIFSEIISRQIQSNPDFLIYDFNDYFLDYIKKEINEAYNEGHYLAVMILSRKLIECVIFRICEVVFNEKDANGTYNRDNHILWFNLSEGRNLGLDKVLDNLKDNSSRFYGYKDLVEEICLLTRPLKNRINKMVHRDYIIPTKEIVDDEDIPGLCNKLRRLYGKYCNP